MHWLLYPLMGFLAGLILTKGYLYLNRRIIAAYDHPTARGMHTESTAVGGGLPLMIVVCLMWLSMWPLNSMSYWILAGTVILVTTSWIDDMKHIRPHLRFGIHLLVVGLVLTRLDSDTYVFLADWPIAIDRLVTAFCWLWFINLFNFMDGIDGLAGAETIAIAFGILAVSLIGAESGEIVFLSLAIIGAATGFLVFNWHPARIFLGDVGSVPLGFLLGWLLIETAIKGQLAAAFILPLYFLGDATTTLVLRLTRGEKIWQPHRQHYYQRAALAGWPHSVVVMRISMANLVLLGLALYSLAAPYTAFVLALVVVFSLFYLLSRMAKSGPS